MRGDIAAMKSYKVYKDFFHPDSNIYRKRVRTFLEYTVVPVVFAAVFFTVCLFLSFNNLMNNGLMLPAAVIIAGVLLVFALIVRIMLEIAENQVRTHSKYTYIEIGLKEVVVSLYAGSFTNFGEKTVLRKIFVIPLSDFHSAEVTNSEKIRIKGRIRSYTGNSDRLGYKFKDGNFEFSEFFYQNQFETGFCVLEQAFIPRRFLNAENIAKSINFAKKRYDSLPPEKPYVFKELPHIRAKKFQERNPRQRNF